jgi:hypothetical protein
MLYLTFDREFDVRDFFVNFIKILKIKNLMWLL